MVLESTSIYILSVLITTMVCDWTGVQSNMYSIQTSCYIPGDMLLNYQQIFSIAKYIILIHETNFMGKSTTIPWFCVPNVDHIYEFSILGYPFDFFCLQIMQQISSYFRATVSLLFTHLTYVILSHTVTPKNNDFVKVRHRQVSFVP